MTDIDKPVTELTGCLCTARVARAIIDLVSDFRRAAKAVKGEE